MPYVRITTVVAKDNSGREVERLLRAISKHYAEQPGYIQGYFLSPNEGVGPNRFGRVGIWEDEDAAERAAQASHAMALRSELLRAIDEDSHLELSFEGEPDLP
jgi:heme-degrading monooxygenase HmoA